jgi:hypothetical protein
LVWDEKSRGLLIFTPASSGILVWNRKSVIPIRFRVLRKEAVAGERNPGELGFEILIFQQILDRNSNVRFHELMVAIGLQQSLGHDLVHSPVFNHSWALSI